MIFEVTALSFSFLFSSSWSSCGRVSSRSIHYIPDFFFLKHSLSKVGLLRPILKVAELLSLALAVVILVSYFADLDDLGERKKCNIGR